MSKVPRSDTAKQLDGSLDEVLFERVSALIEQTRTLFAAQVNAALGLRNWDFGRLIDTEVLREKRAGYAEEIVATLWRQLTVRHECRFDRTSLYRTLQFAQTFADRKIVAALSRQLSWGHFNARMPIYSAEARQFYIDQAKTARLSQRALRELIYSAAHERVARREVGTGYDDEDDQ